MRYVIALLLVLVACAQAPVKDSVSLEKVRIPEPAKETVEKTAEITEIEEVKENADAKEVERNSAVDEVKQMGTIVELQTNMGLMKVILFDDEAPKTTDNFKKLVEQGFYDGTIFHRVIKDFMIQGGDPTGTGTGGPGYTIDDEFGPGLRHDKKGILSMANSGPNTGGSQFFITLAATPWLDGKHAIFGKLIEGEDVLERIGGVETDAGDRPVEEVKIVKATIV